MNDADLLRRITVDPRILMGKPIIRSRRIAVEHVLGMLATGDTSEIILRSCPFLEPEDIQACLAFGGRLQRITLDKSFQPCPAEPGDELYPNGIFEFNITRLLAFVAAHAERFPIEHVEVGDIPDYGSDHLDEGSIRRAVLSRPILLAEISPGLYNVIDGHHRLAKARREGAQGLPARRVHCPDHVPFLTSTAGYEAYVEYWNGKLRDARK